MLRSHFPAAIGRKLRDGEVVEQIIAAAVVVLIAGAMAAWTWNAWADPIVDFGRETYVAWRLCCGDRLYHDIAYFNGPLSPAVNALAMKIAGPSLGVIYSLNAIILTGVLLLVNRLMTEVGGRRCGAVCSIVFVGWFAFALYTHVRGFNYLAPYSHEMTHGIALSLLGLWLLVTWSKSPRTRYLSAAGVVLGLLFLTKPEIFLAAVLGYAAVVWLLAPPDIQAGGAGRRIAAVLAGSAALVWVAALAALASFLPWPEALAHSFGAWPHVVNSNIHQMYFYRWVLGLDDPPFRVATLIFWLLLQVLCLRYGLKRAFGAERAWNRGDLAMLAVVLAIAAAYHEAPRYANALAAAPVWLAVVVVAGWTAMRRAEDPSQRRSLAAGVALAIFSLVLLAKTPLNTNIFHYGFGLAMPGTMILIAAVFHVAQEVERRGGSPWRFALPTLLVWGLVGTIHLLKMGQVVDYYGEAAIQAAGAVGPCTHQDEKETFDTILAEIARRSRPDQTVAVWPQGALVNVLSLRRNPTPYIVLLPPEIEMFGEDAICRAYQQNPPDFIVLAHCDTRFYGQGWFGADYATNLWRWMERHYVAVAKAGAEPFKTADFGMVLLQRRPTDGNLLSSNP
jgi:hypothetical protein